MLAAAELPIIHAGSGVIHAGAYDELRRVAELLHAPVTTSWAARGVLPETSELAIPMPFIPLNNEVRNDADLVLVVGSRLGETDWWGKAPNWRHPSEQQMIQVDIDGHVLGANKPAALDVLADAKLFLAALAERLATLTGRMNLEARRRKVAKYRQKAREERAKLDEKLADMAVPMNPAHVAHVCQQAFPADIGAGRRRRQRRRVGHDLHTSRGCRTRILSTFKLGMLGAGVAQATRRGGGAARPPGLLHHRRRRHGLPPAGSRDGRAQRPARHLPRALRQAVGHGEDEPAVHASSRSRR
jgi:acetolactate synthase I/II/III large subunit